ncbi:unnamed protein product [Onchocerca flexuosa]|uniref:Secreted protein n=1 Tax=Onchocerca flexuosa TaxID=387005 RepID=A0A183I439_9BILA|nr:unnamed protein product [Onchocerca flexuosa]
MVNEMMMLVVAVVATCGTRDPLQPSSSSPDTDLILRLFELNSENDH